MAATRDSGRRTTVVVIAKYEHAAALLAGVPYEVTPPVGNSFTPRGDQISWKLFSGAGAGNEFFSGANTYIKIGDSAAAATGTGQPYDLQGTNTATQKVDAGFPTQFNYGSQTLQYSQIAYQATFDGNTANGIAWREMGIVNGAAVATPTALTTLTGSGTLFNRALAPDPNVGWGTKVAGTVWVATLILSIT